MKFTLVTLAALVATASAVGAPRAELLNEQGEVQNQFIVQTTHNELQALTFRQFETSVEKRNRLNLRTRRQRRLGKGSRGTSAPTDTPVILFQVADDDEIITEPMNGDFRYIDADIQTKKCFKKLCEGKYEARVTGTMDGHGCSVLEMGAAAIDEETDSSGRFQVTCPGIKQYANATVTYCKDSIDDGTDNCAHAYKGIEHKGAGVEFSMPAVGTHIVLSTKCCPCD